MKFIHLSDLHIGKSFNEQSLAEEQKDILGQILAVIDSEKPDAVLIAGDVYDKSQPSGEAVSILDEFLVNLSKLNTKVFLISGNHDSPERLSFGNRLIESSGIYISPVYDGHVEKHVINDEFGPVNIYMLPFVKPFVVKSVFRDDDTVDKDEIGTSYTAAVKSAIDKMNINKDERNIILSHQFVTGAERSDSEITIVGGLDNVDASVYDDFDYVALGHIHKPQILDDKGRIRYSGTPLKYSFSEVDNDNGVLVVEIGEKGSELKSQVIPLIPLRDVKSIQGKFEDLIKPSFYEGTSLVNDYLRIELEDEEAVINAMQKLRIIYKNLLAVRYLNETKVFGEGTSLAVSNVEEKSPEDIFADLYNVIYDKDMTVEQKEYIKTLVDEVWERE